MNPQRTGYGMGIAATIIAAGVLYLLFSQLIDQRDNPNREVIGSVSESGVREVELRRNRAGHYVADGAINGREVTFLLDTGATTVAIPGHLEAPLALDRGIKTWTNTANGVSEAYMTRLDSVSLGPIQLTDVSATIAPGYESDEILLGMAFLKHLEFSQRGDILTIRQYPDKY